MRKSIPKEWVSSASPLIITVEVRAVSSSNFKFWNRFSTPDCFEQIELGAPYDIFQLKIKMRVCGRGARGGLLAERLF
jgi:hypothetical protein